MTLINAHRGDPIGFVENTMLAFQSAIGLGADCIELDVHRSDDGVGVVIHDDTLSRLWGINLAVASTSYAQILHLSKSVGEDGAYIPRLEEVMTSFDIPIMIDFSEDDAVEPIFAALRQQSSLSRFIVSSGNIEALMHIHESFPQLAIALTWTDIVPPSEELLRALDVTYFNPYFRVYQDDFVSRMSALKPETPEQDAEIQQALRLRSRFPHHYQLDRLCGSGMVHEMHGVDRRASAWTVDDEVDMRDMIRLGVDVITTNEVKKLVEVRRGYETEGKGATHS